MKTIGIVCLGISVALLLVLCWHDALFISIPIKPSLCLNLPELPADGTACGSDKIVSPWFILTGLIALFGLLSMFGARFYNLLTRPVKKLRAKKKSQQLEKAAEA